MRNTQGLDRNDRLLLGAHHGTLMTASSAGGASAGRTIFDFTSAKTLDKSSTKRLEASIENTYTQQKLTDGGVGGNFAGGWDRMQIKKPRKV